MRYVDIFIHSGSHSKVVQKNMGAESVRVQTERRLEELTSEEVVEKIAKAIKENVHMVTQYHNAVFALALKEAGFDAHKILSEAARKLIETTRRKKGRDPPITRETITLWLAAWREYVPDEVLETYVYTRLVVISRMIQGDFWIKEVGKNLVVITDGETTYKIGNGWLKP